jgi:type II pantothenate kinase
MTGGNIFLPYASAASTQSMLRHNALSFEEAKAKYTKNTKFYDMQIVSKFLPRSYRRVVIFLDNSGADAILGIFPFTRYLLEKGSTVIFACNSFPSVNDVVVFPRYRFDNVLGSGDEEYS